jgi:hypothetical protein
MTQLATVLAIIGCAGLVAGAVDAWQLHQLRDRVDDDPEWRVDVEDLEANVSALGTIAGLTLGLAAGLWVLA